MIERYGGNGRYHNAVICNGVLYLSGQTATEAGDDIALQSEGTLKKSAEFWKSMVQIKTIFFMQMSMSAIRQMCRHSMLPGMPGLIRILHRRGLAW